MRTRNRFLPVFLLVLAAFTLATFDAPVATATRRPPPVNVYDAGDPDENSDYKASSAPPPLLEPVQLADRPSPPGLANASAQRDDSPASAGLRVGQWPLRRMLFYVLFQSPLAR